MIVGGKNKETGTFVFKVYDASNELFATVEGSDYCEAEQKAHEVQREALSPIIGGLSMSDDELLAELLG